MELRGSVTSATAQGLRSHQEDRFLVYPFASRELRGYLLAVMDGHDGSSAADVCVDAIPELFVLAGPEDLEASLHSIVAGLDQQTRGMTSGSTVSLACILESHGRAAIAVLGDSPVVAVDRGGEMVLSPSHNVRSNPEERRTGERRGGIFRRGYLTNPATGYGL
jgi:serine/threonine protein phosphatase PrpC